MEPSLASPEAGGCVLAGDRGSTMAPPTAKGEEVPFTVRTGMPRAESTHFSCRYSGEDEGTPLSQNSPTSK